MQVIAHSVAVKLNEMAEDRGFIIKTELKYDKSTVHYIFFTHSAQYLMST
jgi:hypothetical protein